MAIQDITKPMALDETLQATNQALGGVAKDTSLQATNTALGLLGKDSSLQAIVTALATIGLNTVGNLAQLTTEQKTSLVAAINELMAGKIPNSAIGAANGVAELDANGLVPSSQIPDAVDEVIEGYLYNGTFYEDSAHTKPITGKTGKIYVDLITEKTYRWGGSAYAEISASLALGETSSTAYRGDRGKTAYDHSQDASRVTSAIVEGLYKVGATAQGHISSLSAVQKSDITALGIPGQDTTYSDATQSVHGLMSANDKTKLDGISTGANKVEDSSTNGNIKIDNVETPVYDDSDIQGKISTALTPISGNPISISGLKSTQLAVEPVVTFEPIQAGSGTPSPENIRPISGYDKIEVSSCSVNLNDESTKTKQIITDTGEIQNNASENLYDYICISESKNYIISAKNTDSSAKRIRISYFDANKTFIVRKFTDISANTTGSYDVKSDTVLFGIPSGCKYIRINHADGISEIMFYEGLGVSAYVPYHKTTDLSESLGQTVYGLTHEVRVGKARVTLAIADMGDLSWVMGSGCFITTITNKLTGRSSTEYANNPKITCSCFKTMTNLYGEETDSLRSGFSPISSLEDNRIVVFISGYSSADAFKTAMTGQKLVYPLATPTEIQLTPHEIALSEGYAYVSTNGTTIALKYHDGEMARLSDVEQLAETVENKLNELPYNLLKSKQFTRTSDTDGRVSFGAITDMIPMVVYNNQGYYTVIRNASNNANYYYGVSFDDSGSHIASGNEGIYTVFGLPIK